MLKDDSSGCTSAMAFVRSSKFRHVLGTPAKKDKCYDTIKITRGPHESDMSSINSKFLAVVTEVQGGGAFLVLPVEKVSGAASGASLTISSLPRLGGWT